MSEFFFALSIKRWFIDNEKGFNSTTFFFLLLRNNNGINIFRCGAKRYFSTLLSLLSLVCVSIILSSTIFRNVCRYLCENQQQPQRMEQMDETNESFHFSLAAIRVSTIASTHTHTQNITHSRDLNFVILRSLQSYL